MQQKPEWEFEMFVENGKLIIQDRAQLASYNASDLLDRITVNAEEGTFSIPDTNRTNEGHQIRFAHSGPCVIEATAKVSGSLPASSPQLVICSGPKAGSKLYITKDGIQTTASGSVSKLSGVQSDMVTLTLSYDGTKFTADCTIPGGKHVSKEGKGLTGNEWIAFTGIALRDWQSNNETFKSVKFKRL